jgi:hypothetical protein
MAAVPGRLPLIEPMLAAPTRDVPINADGWGGGDQVGRRRVIAYISL